MLLGKDMIGALHELIGDILQEHSPSEAGVFKAVGYELIANELNAKRSDVSDLTEFGFGADIESGVLILHLIAGTLSLIEIYMTSRRLKEEVLLKTELQRAWEESLIRHGVPPTLAHLIPFRHIADLLRIIESAGEKRSE